MRRIACNWPYPVPCRVSRPNGVYWTCASSAGNCNAIPGVVGLGEVGVGGPSLGLLIGIGVVAWLVFGR